MNVHGAAKLIALGNAGQLEITVQDGHELVWDGKDGFVGWKYAGLLCHLENVRSSNAPHGALPPLLDPGRQVGRQVATQGDCAALAILFVGCVEDRMGVFAG